MCSAVNLMMMVFCEAFGSRLTMKEYPESSEKQPVIFLTVKGLFFPPLFSFLLFYLFLILASGQMLKINKRDAGVGEHMRKTGGGKPRVHIKVFFSHRKWDEILEKCLCCHASYKSRHFVCQSGNPSAERTPRHQRFICLPFHKF